MGRQTQGKPSPQALFKSWVIPYWPMFFGQSQDMVESQVEGQKKILSPSGRLWIFFSRLFKFSHRDDFKLSMEFCPFLEISERLLAGFVLYHV